MNNLSDMKKDNAFKVPENYFENLNDRIQERIEQEEKGENSKVIDVLKPYIWMVASIAILLIMAKLILTNAVPDNYKIQPISQIEDTNTNTIIESNTENTMYFDEMSDVSTDEIIEYLSDYDIETDELLANL